MDYNCDGAVAFADLDADGWAACEDCDDGDALRNPGEAEVCDAANVDEDCSGAADDEDVGVDVSTQSTWTRDADADGYGANGGLTQPACHATVGYAAVAGDCDDLRAGVNPGAAEVCDADDTDEDCDGLADDSDTSTDSTTWSPWYADADGDAYGDAATALSQCDAPGGWVADSTDCDDGDSAISPAEAEVCGNGVDDDCDSTADDGCPYSGTSAAEGSGEEADYLVYGYESGAEFGAAVASGVDLDDDGDDEWVVGSPGARYPFTSTTDYRGIAYSVRLPTSAEASIDSIRRGYSYGPTATGIEYGARVWAVNDIDEDGNDEYAVFYDSSATASDVVWFVDGGASASGSSYNGGGFHHSGYFIDNISSAGASYSSAVGYNMLMGNTEYSSYKGVIYHYEDEDGASSIGSSYGETASDYASQGLAGGPGQDVDGDGFDDILIGAPGDDDAASNAGAAYLFLADYYGGNLTSADQKLLGGAASNAFGKGMAPAGDVDGDGLADFAVGAPSAGYIYVFEDLDPSGGTVDSDTTGADVTFYGSGYVLGQNWNGSAFSFGDVDGDGAVDALVSSAYYDDGSTNNVGAAWLVYGPLSGAYNLATASGWDARFTGDSTNDYCGWSSALGDVDGDSLQDVLVGCPSGDSSSTTDYGVVAIFMGR